MDTREAYNIWASQYDTNDNKTRDLEARAFRRSLEQISFENCLEIGCGTGKNTEWLIKKAKQVMAIDLSEEMIAKAKEKIGHGPVQFKQADITKDWKFTDGFYDLVCFSLVLEHIEDLDHVFKQTSTSLNAGGFAYIGELHPFKQYSGSKARFDTPQGLHVIDCFNHNISDFVHSARKHELLLWDLEEYFDDNDRSMIPRILALVFRKA